MSVSSNTSDVPAEMFFWVASSSTSSSTLQASVVLEDEHGVAQSSEPLVLNFVMPPVQRPRPWIDSVIRRFGHADAASLNLTEFAAMYKETFPYLGGGELVVEDSHDGHDHRRKRSQDMNISFPENCHPPGEIFSQFDTDRNDKLSAEELVPVMSVFLQMTVDGCHALAAPITLRSCNYVRPTSAESWGYGFLSCILISLLSVLAGVVTMFVKIPSFVSKVLFACGLGGGFGTCILVLFAYITRYPSFLADFNLDGNG